MQFKAQAVHQYIFNALRVTFKWHVCTKIEFFEQNTVKICDTYINIKLKKINYLINYLGLDLGILASTNSIPASVAYSCSLFKFDIPLIWWSWAIFNNSGLVQSSWLNLDSCGRVRTCGRFGDGDDNGGDCIGIGDTFGDTFGVRGDWEIGMLWSGVFSKANTFAGVDGKNNEDRFAVGGVITPLNSRL